MFICPHPSESGRTFLASDLCLQLPTPLSSLQLFNEVTEAEVTLQNSGKVGFAYVVLGPSAAAAEGPLPGMPLVVPSTVSTEVAQGFNPDHVSSCPEECYGGKPQENRRKKP